MKAAEKVKQLSGIIRTQLTPLITNDYILLDVPYYSNVGDTLIWQGTVDFLDSLPFKRKYTGDAHDNLEFGCVKDDIIFLQGGGNFGDLWPLHQNFRNKVISMFPENKIIILPQSIHWEDKRKLEEDAKFFAQHKNVTICVRDDASMNILERYYPENNRMLLPDMAFCIDAKKIAQSKEKSGKTLFVRREDKESANIDKYRGVPKDAVVKDWLYDGDSRVLNWKYSLERRAKVLDQKFNTSMTRIINRYFWTHPLKHSQIKYAFQFLAPYDSIYTTRLHAAILSVIIGKRDIHLIDNSYGKLSSFVRSWLSDVDGLEIM